VVDMISKTKKEQTTNKVVDQRLDDMANDIEYPISMIATIPNIMTSYDIEDHM